MLMKEEPTTDHKFFFYGSLREGHFNNRMLQDGSELLGRAILSGFNLHSLGSYPCISLADDKKRKVVGEIFTIENLNMINSIDRMELGAGYDRELALVKDEAGKEHEVIVYTMNSHEDKDSIVEDGDWTRFVNEKNNEKLDRW